MTVIVPVTPVMDDVAVSVARIVWPPSVWRVALYDALPFGTALSAGKTAAESVLVKWTVPAYVWLMLLKASRALTLTVNAVPAFTLVGPVTTRCVTAAAWTVVPLLLVVIAEFVVSVAVIVCVPAVRYVAEKEPTPFVSVLFAGRVAAGSELVKWTVPE